MDKGPPPLDNRVVKRRDDSFGSAKTGKPFEATKRRPRTVSSCRSAALVRLIIPPQRRDRWFKSSPRNQLFQMGRCVSSFFVWGKRTLAVNDWSRKNILRTSQRSIVAPW